MYFIGKLYHEDRSSILRGIEIVSANRVRRSHPHATEISMINPKTRTDDTEQSTRNRLEEFLERHDDEVE